MPRTLPSISRNLAGRLRLSSPLSVAEILFLRICEIPRCQPVPRGNASNPDRERTPAVRESQRDRAARYLVSGVGCQVSRELQIKQWSICSNIPSFHYSSIPLLQYSTTPSLHYLWQTEQLVSLSILYSCISFCPSTI